MTKSRESTFSNFTKKHYSLLFLYLTISHKNIGKKLFNRNCVGQLPFSLKYSGNLADRCPITGILDFNTEFVYDIDNLDGRTNKKFNYINH